MRSCLHGFGTCRSRRERIGKRIFFAVQVRVRASFSRYEGEEALSLNRRFVKNLKSATVKLPDFEIPDPHLNLNFLSRYTQDFFKMHYFSILLSLILAPLALSIEHAPSIHASPSSHSSHRRIASNIADPDYFAPSGVGGLPQTSGGDGSVVIITKKPTELRSTFFYTGSRETFLFVVPGSTTSSPYHQVVQLKIWGAGGGGCDGGRLKLEESEEDDILSSGYAGGYVEASFDLATGETLVVDVGGGGRSRSVVGSRSSDSSLLGGLGGYNGGKSGYRDRSSGGGGGGGKNVLHFHV